MNRRLILLLACACGAAVSNICYSQPLLQEIRLGFRSSTDAAGLVTMLTQVGYTVGLLLLVPLGDILRRRSLIVGMMVVEALFLGFAALSPTLGALQIASIGIGIASVSAQLIVPLVAQLSEPEKRGQNVGTVMSGLLLGILLARVVAGAVGGTFGWRVMFGLASGISVVLAIVLARALPDLAPTANLRFRDLMRSLGTLVREEPRLRESSLVGGLAFASFMTFWTSLSFHLQGPSFGFSTAAVGMFGLVGAIGALVAPWAGKMADARGPRAVVALGTAVTALSFVLFWIFGLNIVGLILGVLVMDAGVQATHIANQTRVFALRPEARSRINTVYMVAYFLGGSAGSLASTLAWGRFGWSGVCVAGLAFSLVGLAVHRVYGLKRVLATA